MNAPVRFLGGLAAWALVFLLVMSHATVQAAVVVPFSQWQGTVAAWALGVPGLPVAVVPSCSGLDAMGLCVAALLAYPRPWPQRALGAAIGVTVLLGANLARIGTLAMSVGTAWFDLLHVWIWPGALMAIALGFAATWWTLTPAAVEPDRPWPRRVGVALVSALLAYAVLVPVLTSIQVLDLWARDLAALTAALLQMAGVPAVWQGQLLTVGDRAFLVTADCVTSPLMAVYAALLGTWPMPRARRVLAGVLFVPVFVALSILRLLTVALPPVVADSPLFLTHAFHQLLLAMAGVAFVVRWRTGPHARQVALGTLRALAAGAVVWTTVRLAVMPVMAAAFEAVGRAAWASPIPGDQQAVLTGMPPFQFAMYAALLLALRGRVGRRHALIGALVLIAQQVVLLALVDPRAVAGSAAATLVIRAWTILAPAAIIGAIMSRKPS